MQSPDEGRYGVAMRRLPSLAALALSVTLWSTSPAVAQNPRPPAPHVRTILFVGNSFTQGALSAVRRYRINSVVDLTGDMQGGVPALFRLFAEEAGLNYAVSLETQGGQPLGFHWTQRRQLIDRAWDVVVLQEYSALDPTKPGDPSDLNTYAPLLAAMFAKANPRVDVQLMATWSRADLVYRPGSPWSGKPVAAMAAELRRAADAARLLHPAIRGVVPVGEAWNRAIAAGIADPNPYDGIAFGKIDLWAWDHYHASAHGYYLEALVVFGRVTGVDPAILGPGERAAEDLGIAPATAVALQRVARDELAAQKR